MRVQAMSKLVIWFAIRAAKTDEGAHLQVARVDVDDVYVGADLQENDISVTTSCTTRAGSSSTPCMALRHAGSANTARKGHEHGAAQ